MFLDFADRHEEGLVVEITDYDAPVSASRLISGLRVKWSVSFKRGPCGRA